MKPLAYVVMGVVVGAVAMVALDARNVRASETVAQECAAFGVPTFKKGNKFSKAPEPLPGGWTPVGGGGTNDWQFVVACRPAH